jgi:MFS family permease
MNVSPAVRPSSLPFAALVGVTASISVFAVAQGLTSPLFTFLMQKQGFSPVAIGISAAMTPLGLIASAPFVPPAVRLVGARGLAVGCAIAAAILIGLIGLLQDAVAWFLIRFLIGVVINPLYILGEVWMIALAPQPWRGRIMGVFTAITGAGYAAGPLALMIVGSEGWPPLLIGILGFLGCALLLFLTTGGLRGFEDDGKRPGGVWRFWQLAPALLLAVIVSAACQQSVYALLPVFGAAYALPEPTLAALITVMSCGNIVLQIPLGLLAERVGARPMIVACALMNMACALSLPLFITSPAIWPILLVMGGVGYGVYTMALIELGNRFSGAALVAGNAAFALMWGVGGIVGPPISGTVIDGLGAVGLPLLMATLSASLAVFAIYRALRRSRDVLNSASWS